MLKYQTHLDEYSGETIQTTDKPSVRAKLHNLKLYGKSVQNGTPTPENPVPIESVSNSFKITSCGNNLFRFIRGYPSTTATSIERFEEFDRITGTINSSADNSYERGWYRPNWATVSLPDQVILKTGDVITISADVRLIENRNNPTMRIYLYTYSTNDGQTTLEDHSLILNEWVRISQTFTISHNNLVNRKDWCPQFTLNSNVVDIKNIAVKYGTDATFSKYSGETNSFTVRDTDNNLHELYDLPDGTADSIENGKIIKRVKKKVFTPEIIESNAWYYYATWMGDNMCALYVSDKDEKSSIIRPNYTIVRNNYFLGKPPSLYGVVLNVQLERIQIIKYVKQTDLTDKGFILDTKGAEDYLKWMISNSGQNIELLYPYSDLTAPEPYDLHPDEITKLKQLKSVYPQTNIFTGAEVQPTISCSIRKLGNRPFIDSPIIDESGDYLVDENANNIIGVI